MITTLIAATLIMGDKPIDNEDQMKLRTAESLSKDFNAAIGKPRVIAILAPT